ncbi:hypothetical protein CPB97_007443 [Podila verticillata]|nr:hypothetical protein CPB97_007443 [Podila verticillata]
MTIRLDGPACVAVNQDSMYVVNLMGYQSNDQSKPLLALIKTEYPTTETGNNTWSVVSTTPQSFFVPDTQGILYITCDVDNNGVVTLRYENGAGYLYDPLATKRPKAQTCSSASNGLGEWRRADLILPDEISGWSRLIIRSEDSTSTINSNSNSTQDEREAVIYYSSSRSHLTPNFYYSTFNKLAYLSNITIYDLVEFALSKDIATIDALEYGEGQIYSVLGIGTPRFLPGTDRITYNKTLSYFPFNPFNSTQTLTYPPAQAITIPWNVECDAPGDSNPKSAAVVAKEKFYYVCELLIYMRSVQCNLGPTSLFQLIYQRMKG